MRKLIYLSLLAGIALLTACNQKLKVLIVVGGHEYDTIQFFDMFRALETMEFDSVSHPRAMDLLASEQIEKYDLLLFYDFIPQMSVKDSSVYLELTSKGIPLLFMHHSLCTFQEWDGYRQMAGGKYVMPGFGDDTSELSDYAHGLDLDVKILDPDHPVTFGLEEFTIHDEGYSNIMINKEVHPLLGTSHPQCAPLMGWTTQVQNSTCIYLMFGHDRLAYENESLHHLLMNSILWLSKY
ncbi:MAG: ThuA domain-containing protein [Bacteroidota bacterium]